MAYTEMKLQTAHKEPAKLVHACILSLSRYRHNPRFLDPLSVAPVLQTGHSMSESALCLYNHATLAAGSPGRGPKVLSWSSMHHLRPVRAASQRMPHHPQAMAFQAYVLLRAARLQAQTVAAACSCSHGHAAVLDASGVGAAAAAPVIGLILAVPALKPHHLPRGRR